MKSFSLLAFLLVFATVATAQTTRSASVADAFGSTTYRNDTEDSGYVAGMSSATALAEAYGSGAYSVVTTTYTSDFGALRALHQVQTDTYGSFARGVSRGLVDYGTGVFYGGFFEDTLLVSAPGGGTVRFRVNYRLTGATSLVNDGTLMYNANLVAGAYGAGVTIDGVPAALDATGTGVTAFDLSASFIVEAPSGASVSLYSQLGSLIDLRREASSNGAGLGVLDISNTGAIWIDSLTGGATFDSASGHDYTVPVPEPSSLALLGLGLAALARRKRR